MHSLLGKALEKQTKTTEDQGEKQTKANEKSNVLIKRYDYIGKNDGQYFMNQIEIFNKLVD